MTEPISFDEEAEKLQRRKAATDRMQQEHATWIGDCAWCWLPLAYPPIAIPRLETLRWSAKAPDKVDLERTFVCINCASKAIEEYKQQLEAGPINIQGSPFLGT